MITCREDLLDTYITFNTLDDKIVELYEKCCIKFDVRWSNGIRLDVRPFKTMVDDGNTIGFKSKEHGLMFDLYGVDGMKQLTLADFEPEEIPVRSWEGKKPCDMSKDELKEFLCDKVDGIEMEYFRTTWNPSTNDNGASLLYTCEIGSNYRIKREPVLSPQQVKIAELEKSIAQAQQQLQELKSEIE